MTVNHTDDIQGPTVPTFLLIAMALASPEDCVCCKGDIEGVWEQLCHDCAVGIANKTRGEGHPHSPSPAQQAIIDATHLIGGGVVAP